MNAPGGFEDKGYFRRKFPRRSFHRTVGVLVAGEYSLLESGEIGEGGMSIIGSEPLPKGREVVLSFQIPGGDFVCLRGTVRSHQNNEGRVIHGLSFENIQFSHKRQIRTFVSARSEIEEIT